MSDWQEIDKLMGKAVFFSDSDYYQARRAIAEAIMKARNEEREACAKIVEDRIPIWEEFEATAQRIRNRDE